MHGFSDFLSSFEKIPYKGWWRIGVHLIFWLAVLLYIKFQMPNNFLEQNEVIYNFFTLRDFLTTIISFYFIAYFALPFLFNGRWVVFLLSVIFTYFFIHVTMYYTLDYLSHQFPKSRSLKGYAADYLRYGLIAGVFSSYTFWFNSFWSSQFLIVPLVSKSIKDIFQSQIKNLQLERENIQLELNFLKAQVNPHFLFNTLNNIYSLIVDKEPEAADMTLKLSDLMRFSLYESNTEKISLAQELKFIKDYVSLEQVRHNEHVKISMDVKGNTVGLLIPPFILITFVENAFKHGVNSTIRASWMKIIVRVHEHTLDFDIQNSKPAQLSKEKNQGGIGIWNVRKRLDLLYPNGYELSVINNPTTYQVNLKLQLS